MPLELLRCFPILPFDYPVLPHVNIPQPMALRIEYPQHFLQALLGELILRHVESLYIQAMPEQFLYELVA